MVFLYAREKGLAAISSPIYGFYALHTLALVYQLLIAIMYTCIAFTANFDAQFVWFVGYAEDNG